MIKIKPPPPPKKTPFIHTILNHGVSPKYACVPELQAKNKQVIKTVQTNLLVVSSLIGRRRESGHESEWASTSVNTNKHDRELRLDRRQQPPRSEKEGGGGAINLNVFVISHDP